jgi:hypothetical protein
VVVVVRDQKHISAFGNDVFAVRHVSGGDAKERHQTIQPSAFFEALIEVRHRLSDAAQLIQVANIQSIDLFAHLNKTDKSSRSQQSEAHTSQRKPRTPSPQLLGCAGSPTESKRRTPTHPENVV